MDVALCRCGVDLSDHDEVTEHAFEAAGTRHRCEEFVDGYLCPRPRYHQRYQVLCGPLLGPRLW